MEAAKAMVEAATVEVEKVEAVRKVVVKEAAVPVAVEMAAVATAVERMVATWAEVEMERVAMAVAD